MNTREYQNYKRMTKMTVRFLERDGTISDSKSKIETATTTAAATATLTTPRATTPTALVADTKSIKAPITASTSSATSATTTASSTTSSNVDSLRMQQSIKKESTPASDFKFSKTTSNNSSTTADDLIQTLKNQITNRKSQSSSNGRYVNWSTQHSTLASLPWCCIGDLMAFCDKYEYRSLSRNDPQMLNRIVTEVKTLLNGAAPFDIRKRFPSNIHSPENLWVCIGRCTGVEYHLNRIISVFRRPLDKLSADKQRMVRNDFHLAINELRLDISARISEVRLYDQNVFEKSFALEWQEEPLAE